MGSEGVWNPCWDYIFSKFTLLIELFLSGKYQDHKTVSTFMLLEKEAVFSTQLVTLSAVKVLHIYLGRHRKASIPDPNFPEI